MQFYYANALYEHFMGNLRIEWNGSSHDFSCFVFCELCRSVYILHRRRFTQHCGYLHNLRNDCYLSKTNKYTSVYTACNSFVQTR